ncbi:MAG: OmpA family protein [Clostridiales bacterium]|jgi:chemotaxis protein MotB|nr:OmpA family protein [Clostridiales bacterium]
MTLLLAVFLVRFASSQVDAAKAEAISQAFVNIFGLASSGYSGDLPTEGSDNFLPGEGADVLPAPSLPENIHQADYNYFTETKERLKESFELYGLENDVSIFINEWGLVISLLNDILFDSGSAEIKPDTQQALVAIGNILSESNYTIRVEGHTDNVPMHSGRYPSNWELSSARSSSVVRLFADTCNVLPERLQVVGYGEFNPIADNNTSEGRAQNRRVNIIILN